MARLRPEDAAKRKESGRGPDFLEALARGLKVMRAFGTERPQMTLSDVARATDLPKPSVRRALHTLAALGYVATDGRVFRLSPGVLTLATAYLGSNMMTTVIQPACRRISERTDESCFAAVLEGHDIVMIAHSMPRNVIELGPPLGMRRPAFCTAAGRAILSSLSDEALDAWLDRLEPKRVTEFTVTDKKALRKAILEVRRLDYSITEQEVRRGYRAVACPIRKFDGRVVAALCVAAWIEDGDQSRPEAHVAALREETEVLRQQLI